MKADIRLMLAQIHFQVSRHQHMSAAFEDEQYFPQLQKKRKKGSNPLLH